MERFVISYPLNGIEEKLYVEQMDHDKHRFSIDRDNEDRKLYDNNPIIIEKSGSGIWALSTENNWSIDSKQINEIGRLIERHRQGDAGFETGVNAT
ncbi:hypothetical protein [Arcticibacter sp.]|jgi:hypothetical protein|uniref:hypothetical protein n=1 Tax=Arcticibacter sp. TaxID=1872630 RepID=UPI00388FDFA9